MGLLGGLGSLRGREVVISNSVSSIVIRAKISLSSGSFAMAVFAVDCGLYPPCRVFIPMPLAPPFHAKPGGNWPFFPPSDQ